MTKKEMRKELDSTMMNRLTEIIEEINDEYYTIAISDIDRLKGVIWFAESLGIITTHDWSIVNGALIDFKGRVELMCLGIK